MLHGLEIEGFQRFGPVDRESTANALQRGHGHGHGVTPLDDDVAPHEDQVWIARRGGTPHDEVPCHNLGALQARESLRVVVVAGVDISYPHRVFRLGADHGRRLDLVVAENPVVVAVVTRVNPYATLGAPLSGRKHLVACDHGARALRCRGLDLLLVQVPVTIRVVTKKRNLAAVGAIRSRRHLVHAGQRGAVFRIAVNRTRAGSLLFPVHTADQSKRNSREESQKQPVLGIHEGPRFPPNVGQIPADAKSGRWDSWLPNGTCQPRGCTNPGP